MKRMRRLLVAGLATASFVGSAAFAADADVTGNWSMTVESPAGTGTPTFALKQTGKDVTGTYRGALGEAAVTGTVNGNEISLKFTVSGGMDVTVTYAGIVDGHTMKGKVSLGDLGEGTFTGKKT